MTLCRHPCVEAAGHELCRNCAERARVVSGVRVYFAEMARYATVEWNEVTRGQLAQLVRRDGVYLASTRGDYLVLRPHERVV